MTKKTQKTIKNTILKRTPVIAVMGHVDHGKTSLLDAIRGTSVQSSEVGGITQNTRSHQIVYKDQKITFIDTPGHEAFFKMRERGAKVTDIVLLVVAADDGVQPQTIESIKFAQEEKVPIIVAINKIDLPGKNIQKLKQQLASNNLLLEDQGGDVICVELSAKTKVGLDNLLDNILALAEILDLKKEKVLMGKGSGFVLESTIDKYLGPVSLVIMKSGKIKKGEYVVYEGGYSKIRDLLNEDQSKLIEAEQGDPVWIIGFEKALTAGEIIQFLQTEHEAKELSKQVEKGDVDLVRESQIKEYSEITEEEDLELLTQLFDDAKKVDETNYLNIVLKADSQGTLEAIKFQLNEMNDETTKIQILLSGTGDISEKDVITAKNAKGIVIGFQVDVPKKIIDMAKKEKVLVRKYEVIYELIDEVAEVMDGLGQPVEEEIEVARARVKKIFKLSNGQFVTGSEVIKGSMIKGYRVYILRGEDRITDAKITSIKQNKNDIKEAKKGLECGILLEPNIELNENDEIVAFKVEKL